MIEREDKSNLMTIVITKVVPCKDMSRKIDTFINLIVMYFKKSSKRKNVLLWLQEEFVDSTKYL